LQQTLKKPVPMKKLIALAMVCGFALAFIACGGGSTNNDETNDADQDTAMTQPDTTSTDTTATDTTAAQ
jgi:hypothetical protein